MGGCASKPKESDGLDSVPCEAPPSPKKAGLEEKSNNGGGDEAPLIDVSEPKNEGDEDLSKTKAADVTTNPPEEDKDKATAGESEKKVEAVDGKPKDGKPEQIEKKVDEAVAVHAEKPKADHKSEQPEKKAEAVVEPAAGKPKVETEKKVEAVVEHAAEKAKAEKSDAPKAPSVTV